MGSVELARDAGVHYFAFSEDPRFEVLYAIASIHPKKNDSREKLEKG